jgi:hypothetical protein
MRTDDDRPRLPGPGASLTARVSGLLGKVLTLAVAGLVLVAVFMFSLLVFSVVVTAGLLVAAYLWWKTRALRRQLRERPAGGHLIEGEASREFDARRRAE